MSDELRRTNEELRRENAMLRQRFNEVLAQVSARDTFVRWFATEYGLATFGRKPAEMIPGKQGVGRWLGWFASLLRERHGT